MPIFIANQTALGGEVQLWPDEWKMVLEAIMRDGRGGPVLAARIRDHLPPPGHQRTAPSPIRIALTNDEVEMVVRAMTP